ncbi:hypothetical protein BDV95DRAFT_572480 [Massariosphaeria phaeospora]|uniref:Uncharacterized protein n=1 Tax=Massariosphaeria phaeospora TaxID=100035 RepID=A0A7C8MAA9_9PLEO|nr:hypothetical protein BDV95DRAFT_572480 [Massariosphaeria phaeospora]
MTLGMIFSLSFATIPTGFLSSRLLSLLLLFSLATANSLYIKRITQVVIHPIDLNSAKISRSLRMACNTSYPPAVHKTMAQLNEMSR